MLEFTLIKKDKTTAARRGRVKVNHGEIETPIFMPVGTYGSVKAMSPLELKEIDAHIILGNTFHLWLRPGMDVINKIKGVASGNTGGHQDVPRTAVIIETAEVIAE